MLLTPNRLSLPLSLSQLMTTEQVHFLLLPPPLMGKINDSLLCFFFFPSMSSKVCIARLCGSSFECACTGASSSASAAAAGSAGTD